MNDVGIFVTVVETAGFSAAAARLGLPKSSVSRAIARLEEQMGVRLLYRTTRKVSPSTAGVVLYERAREQVRALRTAVRELPELDEEPSGRVRVTAPLGYEVVLTEVIRRFVERHPAVEVDLRLTNAFVDLVAEGVDIALRFSSRRLKNSSLHARRVMTARYALFASPSYLARRGLPRAPRDLDRHEWVVFGLVPQLHLEGDGPRASVTPRGRIVCNDLAFVRSAVADGCGVGALSPLYAQTEVAAGRLVRILPRWIIPMSTLWVVWPGSRRPPRKVSAFLDLLLETIEEKYG